MFIIIFLKLKFILLIIWYFIKIISVFEYFLICPKLSCNSHRFRTPIRCTFFPSTVIVIHALLKIKGSFYLGAFFHEMGRHEAVWSSYPRKIDLAGTPERFQALPGVETGLQDRPITDLRCL